MTKAVLAPLETIRTRMVVGVGPKHIAGSFLEIIEDHGWRGLWAGNTVNMLRTIPSQAIELGTFECVKQTMSSIQEDWKENGRPKLQIGRMNLDLSFLCNCISPVAVGGVAAGIVSTIICHPLEVLKTRLSGSSAIVCATFNCLLDFYKVRHLVKVEIWPDLILNAEKELGIVAGLQDRVEQVYGGS